MQTSRLTTCEDVAERPSDEHETGSNGVTSYIDFWPSSRSVHRIKPKSCEANARPKQDFAKPCYHFCPVGASGQIIGAQQASRRHSRDLVNKKGPSLAGKQLGPRLGEYDEGVDYSLAQRRSGCTGV